MLGGSDRKKNSNLFWLEETGKNSLGRWHLSWVFPTGEGERDEGERNGKVLERQRALRGKAQGYEG